MSVREMLDKRAGLIAQSRAILEAAEAEDRVLTQEEQNNWDAANDDADRIKETADRHQRQTELEAELQDRGNGAIKPDPELGTEERVAKWQTEQATAFGGFLRGGVGNKDTRVYEFRALQADQDIYGGYMVQPVQFVADLIRDVDNAVYMRQWGRGFQVPTAQTLGAPSLDNDPADPTWTSEILIGSEDSTMSFGRRELHPHPLAKYLKVTRTLLRKSAGVEALVRERLAYKFAVTMENAYLNGTGAGGQPLGVFYAGTTAGITTGQDVTTGNTATDVRFDGLIEAKYALKMQYRARARWMFHRDGVKRIRKLKDGGGAYIWEASVQVGRPDMILGLPVAESEYVPNTWSGSGYVGILGDFSYYWYADALDMEIQRLDELYAATNQVGFIGRMESDGMPVLESAFVRVGLT